MLETFKNTPWEKKLTSENTEALMTFFRGGNFYYYKGYILPCLDRYSMTYNPKDREIPYFGMLRLLLNKWHTSFSDADLKEMQTLSDEAQKHDIRMANYPAYNGTRWFFNNDDLIKKNNRYHLMVNMASIRCDGLESAHDFADAYNYYTADGSTWFQKRGNEYRKAFGAFDVTATPGVTAREGMDKLPPLTNWRGYCSLHNYAAAATYGGDNAVGGFIFEKMNAVDKPGVNDLTGCGRGLKHLYGVKAYKSYFLLGDYMVALGAGITNQTPGLPGHIRTTVEQTERVSEVHKLKGKGRIEWICQEGGFAYSVFPKYRKQAVLTCEQRKTDWVKMNPANKGRQPLPEQVELLQLTIDHGQSPVNASYGYAVYCGDGVPAKRYPFHVLRNDTLIQAVQNTECTVTEAMFYTEDVVLKSKGLTLSVSAPCALLLEQVEDGLVLAVTDALMNPQCTQIIVTVNGKAYICEMPQGALCGKPCVKKVKTAN